MPTESLLWTVLPNGVDPDDGGRLLATVFVSPRLTTDGPDDQKLSEFPAFANWPETLRRLKFEIDVDGVGTVDAERDDRTPSADPDVWKLLFGDRVGVRTRTFTDLGDRVVRSFPAAEIAAQVLAVYEQVGIAHPTAFPGVTDGPIAQLAADLGTIGDDWERLYKQLDDAFDGEQSRLVEGRRRRYVAGDVPGMGARRSAFTQAYRFYDRFLGGQRLRDDPGLPIDPPKPPVIDFHGCLGALGDYPHLLRRLGLAVDVVFRNDPVLPTTGRLRLVPAGDPEPWMTTEAARPWLHYQRSKRFFLPRPRVPGRDIIDGQLPLAHNDHYSVQQIDIDGSAMKTMNVASSAARLKRHLDRPQPSVTPDATSLPALRSTGFTVIRSRRAAQVVEQFDHATLHDRDETVEQPTELHAEDVSRGYRVEVDADLDGRFRSLCERTGDYRVAAENGVVTLDVPPDEGYVKAASTTSVPGDAELYLHEAVFSWGGWSLVAHRPGQLVNTAEEIEDPPAPTKTDPGVPLLTTFRATPRTLPRLRYGTSYRFRVRVVDLAGNSVPRDVIDDAQASDPQPFYRWEPVGSPAVYPTRTYGEGESQLRMVIRSTFGTDVTRYVALPRVAGLAGHTDPATAYLAVDHRWLAAPKTSQQAAEYHGVFDDAIGSGPGPAVDDAFNLAAREAGVLPAVIDGETLALPYLPDVSSRGVAVTSLPDDPLSTPTRRIPWPTDTGAWWDRQPFRIRIVDGPAAAPVTPEGDRAEPRWDPDARILTVFLPQAELVTVRLSSFLEPRDLDIQGLWSRIGTAPGVRRDVAEDGRHWMFTPWSELTLVHAVEKPLLAPVIDVAPSGFQRKPGETFCALVGSVDTHAKSTGRLDLEASWTEQIDTGPDGPDDGVDGRPIRSGFAHVGDFTLESDEDDCRIGRDEAGLVGTKPPLHQVRHEFGDTRHRRVSYRAVATTRFREYFPPAVIEGYDPDDGWPTGPGPAAEPGAIRERLVTRVGPSLTRDVPSSRRPDPPDIDYILPTFSWTTETRSLPPNILGATRVTTSTRHGGGLRVYLKRPWYSSGDGEQLGVILRDQPWLTWQLDAQAGIALADGMLGDAVRAQADRIAQRVFDRGVLTRPIGGSLTADDLIRAAGVTASPATDRSLALRQIATGLAAVDARLGPILGQFLTGQDPENLRTRWGRDPIWGAAAPASGPFIHQFPLRTSVGTGLSLAETPSAAVTVVGHTPRWNADRQLWYCDLQLTAGSSYTPFVRLGLTRYQAHSIPGKHLSTVVVADFTQLLPDRVATFTALPNSVAVSVRGPAAYTAVSRAFTTTPASAFGMQISRRMTVQRQQLGADGDPDLGWADVGDPVELPAGFGDAGLSDVTWMGAVPIATAPAGSRQRLLLREYEVHDTDADDDDPDPLDATRVLRGGSSEFPTLFHVRERIVYADTYEL